MTFHSSMRLAFMAFMALMLAVAWTHPTSESMARGFPEPPSEDEFYQPPEGFENEPPGTILRTRGVTTAFLGLIPNPVEANQILYRTTAVNGSAIATVTTVFKPWFPKEDRFVSFHTAYDSSATKCNPSFTYQWGAPPNDLITSAEMLILQVYLTLGYVVASPDYEGPDAAFSPGHIEGMNVLDNMRAVSSFEDSGLSTNNPMIVGVGYSGGAIGTGWAAALQPSYAPELDIKGWVAGGTPANLKGTLLTIDNSLFSGFIPPALAGLLKPSAYAEELAPLMNRVVTDKGRDMLEFANSHCAVADLLQFPYMSLFDTDIQTMGDDLLSDPTIAAIMRENILGAKPEQTPTAPVFVYHATADEIIPYSNASAMVDSWCGYGADVKFTTFAAGGHATTEVIAVPDAVKWVESAFAGDTGSGCSSNTELKSDLNPLALGVQLEPILVKLVDALVEMGDGDGNILDDLRTLKKTVGWDGWDSWDIWDIW